MARPQKKTVEYFPHYAKSGRTIYILEAKYGNDGYAFWFKLLELLCDTEGQVYDCGNAVNWEFLTAKTRVTSEKAEEILDTLASLCAIDGDLWKEHRTIWVENLINHLSSVYSKRNVELPKKPTFITDDGNAAQMELSERKPEIPAVPEAETPQSKVKESKENKRINSLVNPPHFQLERIVEIWNESVQTPRVAKLTDERKTKVKARIKEWGCKTQEEAESYAANLFQRIKSSDFLSGRDGKWRANFDWLFANDKNYLKVQEGNYDNNRTTGAKTAPVGGDSRLGVGEYLTEDGRRTYGTGRATIPQDAPPRPSDRYVWNDGSQNWIIQ